jgi:5-methylcytosine-specific restriction endonuclease McrA
MLRRKKPLKRTPIKRSATKAKPRKAIRKRSKKMSDTYVERRKLVEKVLQERPLCEACKIFATHDGKITFNHHLSRDLHEVIRRSQGGSILDEENILAVCRPCHTRITANPQLAFDLGLAKHGWER